MLEIAIQAGQIRSLENLCKYDKTRMMHVGNPGTLKKHPELYAKYFRGWLMAHKLLKDNPGKTAGCDRFPLKLCIADAHTLPGNMVEIDRLEMTNLVAEHA